MAGRAASMSPRLYRQIETARANVTAATLTRLAEALGVDVATLLAPAPVPPPRPRGRPHKALNPPAVPNPPDIPSRSPPPSTPNAVRPAEQDVLPPPSTDARAATESTALDPVAEATRLLTRLAELRGPLLAQRADLVVRGLRLHAVLRAVDESSVDVGEAAGSEPTRRAITLPPLPPPTEVREIIALLLKVNPQGLLGSELEEAARALGYRPRRNEIFTTVRNLYDAGHLTRSGARGSYTYRLQTAS